MTISKATPKLSLLNSTTGRTIVLEPYTNGLYLRNQLDTNNRTSFYLAPETETDLNKLARLIVKKSGAENVFYNLFGTHNIVPIKNGGTGGQNQYDSMINLGLPIQFGTYSGNGLDYGETQTITLPGDRSPAWVMVFRIGQSWHMTSNYHYRDYKWLPSTEEQSLNNVTLCRMGLVVQGDPLEEINTETNTDVTVLGLHNNLLIVGNAWEDDEDNDIRYQYSFRDNEYGYIAGYY